MRTGRRLEFTVVDRYGTGDAFCAGLIYRLLHDDADHALDFANAACALAHTIEGDVAHMRAQEVAALLTDSPDLRVRR